MEHQRGLARAVGSDQCHFVPRAHLEGDAAQGGMTVVIGKMQIANL
jgi:hypothetical protein